MKEPKLYLMVMDFNSDQECEWMFFVAEQVPSYEEQEELAKQFMRDNHDAEEEDFEEFGIYELANVWVNHVGEQDNYRVRLEKI